ncbi:zinc ribbon domain-containing protein [Acidipropionibacterium timonense]|uniref:zinc ribbon domain-containing protein n=1 Tax=Acidipropionibacterium timonense TaxID=2161818 RepID=UPI00102FEB4C|nr:C4-type zinc ribbon domain-containing protein [Acidipropionibacterium timonense]
MKAAPQDQWKLLDLVETDRLIARANHRRATLPELAELKELAVRRRDLAEEVVAKQTVLSDARSAQERIEHDLEPARARLARNQATVDSGSLTDHKALRGMVEEIDHLGRRIAELEDAELEAMQAVEDAEKDHSDADRRRIELDQHIRGVLGSRDQSFAAIDKELAGLAEQRRAQAAGVPTDLLRLYDTLHQRTGIGAGQLEHGVCGACGIAANPGDLRRYQSAAPDDVLRCEECDRILVRTARS